MSIEQGFLGVSQDTQIGRSEEFQKIDHHITLIKNLEPYVGTMLSISGERAYLKPITEIWQPSDYLPRSEPLSGESRKDARDRWFDQLRVLQEQADRVSDEVWVMLAGDTITEEALPSYQTWLNRVIAIRDETGTDTSSFGRWGRGWTSEENRHGDVLMTYLRYSGCVDIKAVEQTTQSLIANGFNPLVSNEDPYEIFIYTAFQERATRISHGNVGRLAARQGADTLKIISGLIASDEGRHERFYSGVMKKIFEVDPEGAVIAFANMMKRKIVMPAALMTQGEIITTGESNLFKGFSAVAQRTGVYTAEDYYNIVMHLRNYWGVENLQGLGKEAQEAQIYLKTTFTKEIGKRVDTVMNNKIQRMDPIPFPWIDNREISLANPSITLRPAA